MRSRALAAFFFFGLVLAAIGAAQERALLPKPGEKVLRGLGPATLSIDGEWQFHLGDDLAWASPSFDDSGWEQVETGKSWEEQGHRDYTGFAWYRRKLVMPANTPGGWDLSLWIFGVQDACEVYWNGKLVGSYGAVPPHAVWYESALGTQVLLGPAQSGELALRVWKAPYTYETSPNVGGLVVTPRIGSREATEGLESSARLKWLDSKLYVMALMLVCTLVSLIALQRWLRDRQQWLLLLLALYMLRPLLTFLDDLPGVSFRVSYGLVGVLYSSEDAVLWFLLLLLLGLGKRRRLVQWTWAFAIFTVVMQVIEGSEQLFDWSLAPRFFLWTDVGTTVPCLLLEAYPLFLLASALRNRLHASRWLVAVFASLTGVLAGVRSILDLGQRWTHWTAGRYLDEGVGTANYDLTTVFDTMLLASILYAVWHFEREQHRRQVRIDEELKSARAVQQVLIPDELPQIPGFAIESVYKPAGEVGGDFFQIVAVDGGVLAVIGDVSGKGMPAAMTVSLLVGTFRTLAHYTQSPAEILQAMNQRMIGRNSGGFTTCLCVRIDADGTMTAANAGHLAPYIDGTEIELDPGLPLGLAKGSAYEDRRIELRAGARVTLYTDGVVEAQNERRELFGFERAAALAMLPAQEIAHRAQAFGQEDDITVVTLTRAVA